MSTPAQKANLARIRDNQRRSRARKREYLQELEQRLRTCELQGIEASAEVQMAARRVADENRHLRGLLHKQGVSDEYINHYLQTVLVAQPEMSQAAAFPHGSMGPSVQSLQQLLTPRRPNCGDSNVQFPIPSQASREASIASASTSTSSLWDAQQHGIPPTYSHQQQPMTIPAGGIGGQTSAQPYSSAIYSGESTPRVDPFPGQQQQQQQQQHSTQQHGNLIEDPRTQAFHQQQIPADLSGASMNYHDPSAAYNSTPRDYGPPGGYC